MALGETNVGVLFRLRADYREASGDIDTFKTKVKGQLSGILDAIPGGDKISALAGYFGQLDNSMSAIPGAASGATTALGGVAATATVVVGAIAAVVAIVAAVGVGLFALANYASDVGSRFNDLSVRTQVSVETLTALNLTAIQTGTTLEEVAGGLNILYKTLGAAERGVDSAREKLRRLGVDSKVSLGDQDAVLGAVFKRINELPNGYQKVVAAQEAFGRSGSKLLGLIKEVGGDFKEFKRRAEEAGEVLSKEDVAAADRFGDEMDRLSERVKMAVVQIGLRLLPQIQGAIDDITSALAANAQDWKVWGDRAALYIATVRGAFRGLIESVRDGSLFIPGGALVNIGRGMNKSITDEMLRQEKQRQDEMTGGAGGGTGDEGGGAGGGKDKAAEEARRRAIEALGLQLDEIEALHAEAQADLKRDFDLFVNSSQEYTEAMIAAEQERFDKTKAILDARKAIEKPEDNAKTDAAILEAQRERNRNITELQDEQNKRERESLLKHRDNLLDLADQHDARRIDSIRERARLGAETEEAAEEKIFQIQRDAYWRRSEAIQADMARITLAVKEGGQANIEAQREIADAQDDLQADWQAKRDAHDRAIADIQERARRRERDHARELEQIGLDSSRAALDLTELMIRNMNRYQFDRIAILDAERELALSRADIEKRAAVLALETARDAAVEEETNAARRLEIRTAYNLQIELELARHEEAKREIERQFKRENDEANPLSGLSLFGEEAQDALDAGASKWEAFGAQVSSAIGQASQAAGNFGSIINNVMSGVSSALGNAVKNWVLLGSAGGASFRKFTAEILAGVASQAAVKAVWELAEGFAALAKPWTAWQAPFHFKAAALYGTVAAVAAVAGRMVAGNSFQTAGAGAGAGAGASGGGGASSGEGGREGGRDEGPRIIEQGRAQVIEHVITIRPERGLIAEHIQEDYRRNGPIRTLNQESQGIPMP